MWKIFYGLVQPGGVNGHAQFSFRSAQMFFGSGSMTLHVIAIGGTRVLHLFDGFPHMLVNLLGMPTFRICRLDGFSVSYPQTAIVFAISRSA
jgi:hypothetical protein